MILYGNNYGSVANFIDSFVNAKYASTSLTTTDIKIIKDELTSAFNKHFSDDKFSLQKNVDAEDNSAVSLRINEKELFDFVKEILSLAKDNQNIKNILTDKLFFTDSYNDFLSSMIESFSSVNSRENVWYNFRVIYKGNSVKKIELSSHDAVIYISHTDKNTLSFDIKTDTYNSTTKIINNEDSSITIESTMQGTQNSNFKFTVKQDTIAANEDSITSKTIVEFSIDVNGLLANGTLELSNNYKKIDSLNIPTIDSSNSTKMFDENAQMELMIILAELNQNDKDKLLMGLPILRAYI